MSNTNPPGGSIIENHLASLLARGEKIGLKITGFRQLPRQLEDIARQWEPVGEAMSEEIEALVVAAVQLRALQDVKDSVIGWRETDWPEGFDRRTAELIAERAQEVFERW